MECRDGADTGSFLAQGPRGNKTNFTVKRQYLGITARIFIAVFRADFVAREWHGKRTIDFTRFRFLFRADTG